MHAGASAYPPDAAVGRAVVPELELNRLRSRVDYLATAKGARIPRPGFVLQYAAQAEPQMAARIGFTVTRRVGNAVTRNRVRRRLKELARLAEHRFQTGTDYVLVGRQAATNRTFSEMRQDLESALQRSNRRSAPAGRGDA